MKALMNTHVNQERHVMFQHSAESVKKKLVALIEEVEELMKDKADEVFVNIKRDYRVGLGGYDVRKYGDILPRTQHTLRKEIQCILDGAEAALMNTLDVKIEEDDVGKAGSEEGNVGIERPHGGSDDNAPKEELDLSPRTTVTPRGQIVSRGGAHMVSAASGQDSNLSSSPRVSKLESE